MKTLSEVLAPAVILQGPLLEAVVQSRCVAWARDRGFWARKFSSISQRSVPDYLFAGRGLKFATEFKREGAPILKATGCMSTEAQVEEQKAMRAVGWTVFECCDIEDFKKRVLALEAGDWI